LGVSGTAPVGRSAHRHRTPPSSLRRTPFARVTQGRGPGRHRAASALPLLQPWHDGHGTGQLHRGAPAVHDDPAVVHQSRTWRSRQTSGADRQHRNHRRHPKDHAQHREHRPQPVRQQILQPETHIRHPLLVSGNSAGRRSRGDRHLWSSPDRSHTSRGWRLSRRGRID